MLTRHLTFWCAFLSVLAQQPPGGPPDYSNDLIAPYPSLTDPTTANTLGTRLFGWEGCGTEDSDASNLIKDAYDDMNKIAWIEGTYENINWKGQAAKDYFGPSTGKYAIPNDTRTEIQQILHQVQQMYSFWWGLRPSLWIRVRCSGGDGKGDPNNICGDAPQNDPNGPTCPDGSTPLAPPSTNDDNRMEAYADPHGNTDNDYSQITFCNAFFKKLSLSQAITSASRAQTPEERLNLQNYDCQARVFFHEATHLDWFMNAPKTNPFVSDLKVQYKVDRLSTTEWVYGVQNSKILANWRERSNGGYYPQRNADSFAWFAMANYVKSKIGSYPYYPSINKKPTRKPTDGSGNPPPLLEYTIDGDGSPDFNITQIIALSTSPSALNIPQCPDKNSFDPGDSVLSLTVNDFDSDDDYEPEQLAQRQAWLANSYTYSISNTSLRILPLGDSITYGFQSTDGNGYRLKLYDDLSTNGNTVSLIGSVRSGNMADNYNEGHNGATIDEIASYARSSLSERPNVVLIHAGTNDMNLPLDPAGAPTRLGSLIDTVLTTCPDALVLLAQIIPSGSAATQANIIAFNDAMSGVVVDRTAKGSKIMLVDMFTRLLSPDNYADDLHPNNGGYELMGDTWHHAIAYADEVLGWVSPPVDGSGVPGLITCDRLPTWYPQGEIANGAGLGPDLYTSYICLDAVDDPEVCNCNIVLNKGIILPPRGMLKTGSSCADMGYDLIHSVHFADLNGDGRAEYIYVEELGNVTAFLNLGPPSGQESTKGATVEWLSQGVIATGVGAPVYQVQFADLNGDGRAEYLWVHENGSVEAWLNLGGPDDGPNAAKVGWLYNGLVATGIGAPGASVSFADINGDGRADYLSTDANGAVTCYLNLGPTIDDGPHAAVVGWLPQGVIATGVGGIRNNTVFADINGDGRADYLEVERSGSGSVNAWFNGGGPNNGPNAAQVVWYPQGQITTGDGTSGANVVFADLNGDGRAEYIEIDPFTSAVTAYLNGCPA